MDFKIGPFEISITKEHCSNLKLLPQRTSYQYEHDATFSRHVKKIPQNRGEFVPTAIATWSTQENIPPSVLFPSIPGPDAVYDLVILLSFLTGRRVYLEDELDWDPRRAYGERILGGQELVGFANHAWAKLPELAAGGLSDALSCLVQAAHSPDLIGWGAYASAALDSIVTSWASANGKTKFQDDTLIKTARKTIEATLLDGGVSPESAKDIVARLNNIGSPSAITKIKWFLQEFDLFSKTPTEDEMNRLRRLNLVRNAIAHSGTVRIEPTLGPEISLSVAGAVIGLSHEIAELHLARRILGIEAASTKNSTETIKRFFSEGTFRGQKVFEEKFEEYLSRLEKTWLDGGIF
ncbi:hypothetical protein [Variovorax boronicumulans]|uniref:hypothetical protein n=1 Tax=Variovorax boronicumulans TaxID=436515 RepID=UPI00117E9FB6|nr:hypothetical protein [Variovorax boronicumulans]